MKMVPHALDSIQHAAERFGVTTRTVRHWIATGEITGYRLPGGRLIRVDMSEIEGKISPIPTSGPRATT